MTATEPGSDSADDVLAIGAGQSGLGVVQHDAAWLAERTTAHAHAPRSEPVHA